MNVPHWLTLTSGTALYACCAEHAAAARAEVGEVVSSAPMQMRANPQVCCYCCWCGAMVSNVPEVCHMHGTRCPTISPLDMVVLTNAVKLFKALFGGLPGPALFDDWVVQAAAGETDPSVLIAGEY